MSWLLPYGLSAIPRDLSNSLRYRPVCAELHTSSTWASPCSEPAEWKLGWQTEQARHMAIFFGGSPQRCSTQRLAHLLPIVHSPVCDAIKRTSHHAVSGSRGRFRSL